VTAGELREQGVHRLVVPQLERMGAMIVALDEYVKHNEQSNAVEK
jgi:uroporphyrinogen-III synthase